MDRQWFAVRTQPKKEFLAREHYNRQGFSSYLPLVRVLRRHARKVDRVFRPLFSGYLFLHLAPEEMNWTAIGSTIGSIGPVRFGDYFPPVPDLFIEQIRHKENEEGIICLKSPEEGYFRPGQKVAIVTGELEYLEGIFQCKRGKDRALILMDMLSRQVPTTVPVSALKTA